jgi:lysophospholipase L1-like esterase
VVIADWNAAADGKRDYFVSDGIHLTRTGATAFAELIKDSAGL